MASTVLSRLSLKTRITIATLLIFLAGMWSLSLYASRMLQQDMERLLGEQQFTTVTYVAATLNVDIDDRIKALEQIARAIDAALIDNPIALQRFLDQRFVLHTRFNAGVLAYGPDGTAIAESPLSTERIGRNFMDRDYIVGAIKEGRSTISRPLVGRTAGAPVLVMAAPIRDAEGKIIGALSGVTNLSRPSFLDRISENRYGKTGGYLVIDRTSRLIIAATDKSRLMDPMPPPGMVPAIDRFQQGFEGPLVYTNSHGTEILGAAKGVPLANWRVVSNLPTEEAFSPIRDMRQRMLIATLLLTVLAGTLTWWALRRQLAPIIDTAKTLASMSDTNQPLQALPVARYDEIGQMVTGFNRLLKALSSREKSLQASESRFRNFFEQNTSVMLLTEPVSGEIIDANLAAIDYYGYTKAQLMQMNISSINTMPAELIAEKRQSAMRGERRAFSFTHRLASGELRDVEAHLSPIESEGRPLIFSIMHDITERKKTNEALKESEEHYRAIYEASQDFISINRLSDWVFLDINQPFLDVMGYARDELIGHTSKELKFWAHPQDQQQFKETLQRDGKCHNFETPYRTKSGQLIWVLASSSIVQLGGIACVYSVTRDITERKLAEEKINELAFFDQLTNLPNRRLLLDRLRQSMNASMRSGQYGALLLIDLDNFKTLNDTLGHDTGDRLLKQVAQRLVTCVRSEDTVARLGGDEFVVILSNLSLAEDTAASQTEIVGDKIITALNQVYELGDVVHHSTPSIGANLFLGQRTELDTLLKQADIAMYRSKKEGGNTLRFFDSDMETVVMKRAALENDLRTAIDERQFVLHYQAQVSGSRLLGAEALVRWQQPARGLVSPAEFIPLAEDTGLIIPLGQWVLEAACNQITAWAERPEFAHLTISVNVSAHQFRQDNFVENVLMVLRNTHANPQRLKIELTESSLLNNVDSVIEKMYALKAKGVGFSLDDFGTGYSSLSYLKQLPLDQLKIDQSFVRDILVDANDAAIAKTIIVLAQSFGLNVIAEGVETEEQRDYLSIVGCHSCQGYFFSRPLPIDDFERYAQSVERDHQRKLDNGPSSDPRPESRGDVSVSVFKD